VLASLLLNLFWAFFTQNVSATSSTWWQYLDMDGNGTVDHAAIIFQSWSIANNITSCTYNSLDWNVTITGSINLAITWIDTSSGMTVCDGTSNVLYLNVTADAGETWINSSADIEPDIEFNHTSTGVTFTNAYSSNITIPIEDYADPILTEHTAIPTPWYNVRPNYSFNVTEWWDDPDDVTLNWYGSCANYFDTWAMINLWTNTIWASFDMPYGTYNNCSLQININWEQTNTIAITPFTIDFCEDTATTGIPVAECHALKDIYNDLDGANWAQKTNWMTATWVTNWLWVTASGWHVTEISLWNASDQNLSGTLNSSIWDLTSLTYLWLYNSNLTWPIPSTINNLVNLIGLELNDNNLTWSIPALNNLTSLTELNLEDNELIGTIPDISTMSGTLELLSLLDNNLTWNIPSYLNTFTYLYSLDLWANSLTGAIPDLTSTALDYLSLWDNNLSWIVPSFSGSTTMGSTGSLDIRGNKFIIADLKQIFSDNPSLVWSLGFGYDPQQNIWETGSLVYSGTPLTISSVLPADVENEYSWEKNWITIVGQTGSSLVVTSTWIYTYFVENGSVPELVLVSNPITVTDVPPVITLSTSATSVDADTYMIEWVVTWYNNWWIQVLTHTWANIDVMPSAWIFKTRVPLVQNTTNTITVNAWNNSGNTGSTSIVITESGALDDFVGALELGSPADFYYTTTVSWTGITSATWVTFDQPVKFTTWSIVVSISTDTEITRADWSSFDATELDSEPAIVTTWLGVNESSLWAMEFGLSLSSVWINFSKPIKVSFPVSEVVNWTVTVKVKHGGSSVFTTVWLTNDPNSTCSNWVSTPSSNIATVSSGIATIYTCSASTFTSYKTTTFSSSSSSSWGWGGGWVSIDYCPTWDTSWSYYDGKCSKNISSTWSTWTILVDIPGKIYSNQKVIAIEKLLYGKIEKYGQQKELLTILTKEFLQKVDYLLLNKDKLSKEELVKLTNEIVSLYKNILNLLKDWKYISLDVKIKKIEKIIDKKNKNNSKDFIYNRNLFLYKLEYCVINKIKLSETDKQELLNLYSKLSK